MKIVVSLYREDVCVEKFTETLRKIDVDYKPNNRCNRSANQFYFVYSQLLNFRPQEEAVQG